MGHCNFEVSHLIGQGAYGKVYKAYCRQTKETVAYKVISIVGRKSWEIDALRKEYEIGKLLQHPNIIRILYYFETLTEIVLVSEYAKQDLRCALEKDGLFCEKRTSKIMQDLISALFYLHSNKIIHRDLKPQNVVLDGNGNAKLCDFGFARIVGTDFGMHMSMRGTPMYMAPEQLYNYPYDQRADLWSLGVIAYELLTGHTPYKSNTISRLMMLVKTKDITWPTNLSNECLSFLMGLLQKFAAVRLSWPHLLHHPFVHSESFDIIKNKPDHVFIKPSIFNIVSKYNSQPIPHQYHPTTLQSNVKPFSRHHDVSTSHSNNHFYPVIPSVKQQTKFKPKKENTREERIALEVDEWMQFIDRCISNVTYFGNIASLLQEHSLSMIMKAMMNFYPHPLLIIKIISLLSLPFVSEKVPLEQVSAIKQTYVECKIIHDLVFVFKTFIRQTEKGNNFDSIQDKCLKQLTMLLCNLTYRDETIMKQFFQSFLSQDLFSKVKLILSIRLYYDPLAVVKNMLSIFARMYTDFKPCRLILANVFKDCCAELLVLLSEQKDITVPARLCVLISLLNCTSNKHLKEEDNSYVPIRSFNSLNIICVKTTINKWSSDLKTIETRRMSF